MERTIVSKSAGVICQERAALHIDLQDVKDTHPLVAHNFGFVGAVLIPLRQHIVWAHASGSTDLIQFLNPSERIMCFPYRSTVGNERILEGNLDEVRSNTGDSHADSAQTVNDVSAPNVPQCSCIGEVFHCNDGHGQSSASSGMSFDVAHPEVG